MPDESEQIKKELKNIAKIQDLEVGLLRAAMVCCVEESRIRQFIKSGIISARRANGETGAWLVKVSDLHLVVKRNRKRGQPLGLKSKSNKVTFMIHEFNGNPDDLTLSLKKGKKGTGEIVISCKCSAQYLEEGKKMLQEFADENGLAINWGK